MIRIGLLINKQQLDTNMEVIRTKLREKVDIINQLVVDFSTYGKQESTSQALEVLKGYANNEIPDMLNRLRDVFNTIIDKTYKIQDRYEQLCGNCSLNEVDLENNIEILDKILKRTEETKYQLLKVEVISTEQINQQIEDIKELKMLYQDKLDGLLEFDRFSTDIFYDESQEIVRITEDLRSLSSSLESPFISTGLFFDRTNIVLDKLQNENQVQASKLSLEEQEQILGISYEDFCSLYNEMYGFDKQDIYYIWVIKVGIYQRYGPDEGEFYFNYVMGRIYYNPDASSKDETIGRGFDTIIGDLDGATSSETDMKNFLKEISGLEDEEINRVYFRIRLQHTLCNEEMSIPERNLTDSDSNMYNWLGNYLKSKSYSTKKVDKIINDLITNGESSIYINELNEAYSFWQSQKELMLGKTDFVHYSITTATILYDGEEVPSFLERIGEGFDDESGWYGDLDGFNLDKVGSMNNIDYKSDLDAENIIFYQKQKNISNLDQARKMYYEELNKGTINRANYFKKNKPEVLDFVIEKGIGNYQDEKLENVVPPVITSPEGQQAYNNYMNGLCEEYKQEYLQLPFEEKIKYIPEYARNFVYSLYSDSNELVENVL